MRWPLLQFTENKLHFLTGKVVPVEIVSANPNGGWDGKNLSTGKAVRIKSAQRLGEKKPSAKRPATSPTRAKTAAKATGKAKVTTKRHTGERGAKGARRTSGLDAATQVLADAKDPLSAKEMVELMLTKGLWQTTGRTPSATIHAAIIREIAAKGDAARFRKAAPGRFELNR